MNKNVLEAFSKKKNLGCVSILTSHTYLHACAQRSAAILNVSIQATRHFC